MHVERAPLRSSRRECFPFEDRGGNAVKMQNARKRQAAGTGPDDCDTRWARGHALGSFTVTTVLLAKLLHCLLHPGLVPGEASRAQIIGDGLNPPQFSRGLRVKQLNFEPEQSWKEMGRCCP